MCLIIFAIDSHPRFPLVLAANRDEFYIRPTEPLHAWKETPPIVAGRDLAAGGTWLGIARNGRFAAVTNVREGVQSTPMQRSRGELTRAFLLGAQTAKIYAQQVHDDGAHYAGFNLLLGDGQGVYYCSNRGAAPRQLDPGIYGLSNDTLDTPWPKVVSGKAELRELLAHEPSGSELMRILADTQRPPDSALPDTGVGLDLERRFSARFIASDAYGTRASTALLIDSGGNVEISERNFGSDGVRIGELITYRWNYRRENI